MNALMGTVRVDTGYRTLKPNVNRVGAYGLHVPVNGLDGGNVCGVRTPIEPSYN